MPKSSKLTKRTRAVKAIDGLSKRFEPQEIVLIGGKKYTGAQLIALVRRQISALDAVDAATGVLRQAVRDELAVARDVGRLLRDLKIWILGNDGPRNDVLGSFGWEVPKDPGPKKIASKAKMVEKGKRTREARKAALQRVGRGR